MFKKPSLLGFDYPGQLSHLIDTVEGPPGRNYLRNGDFQIAQRGPTLLNKAAGFCALDGWTVGSVPFAFSWDCTQQSFTTGQTEIPGNPQKYMRINRKIAHTSDNVIVENRIEFPELLSSKTMTGGFWARVASGSLTVNVAILSTGTTPVVTTANFPFTLTTSWQFCKFTVTLPGITIGASTQYLRFAIQELTTYTTFQIDIADGQFEVGSEATLFERLSFDRQLVWNQRFSCRSWGSSFTGTVDDISALNSGETTFLASVAAAGQQYSEEVVFPRRMRVVPSMSFFSVTGGTAGQVYDRDASASGSATGASVVSERGFVIGCNGNASTAIGNRLILNWFASAEL